MIEEVVLLLSGGMDSTTLLYYLLEKGYHVHTLTFDYGQKHNREIESARKIAKINDVPNKVVDITTITGLLQGSSLIQEDVPIPEGHYEDESMKSTVVPNRNMILLSLAVGYAVSNGISRVFYAAHSGDHAIYPDCRPEFFDKINQLTLISNYQPVVVQAPFLHKNKNEIASMGKDLGVPFNLTWTCYKGGKSPCGVCGSCVERREAMESIGITE